MFVTQHDRVEDRSMIGFFAAIDVMYRAILIASAHRTVSMITPYSSLVLFAESIFELHELDLVLEQWLPRLSFAAALECAY